MAHKPINAALALAMRLRGTSWKQIGKVLAQQMGRKTPFQPHSVEVAVKRYQKRNLKCLLKG